jgi:glycosyltransferase involved in cell wall biosynthesis
MKIAYVFDRPLPARETDSEQALQTLSAFARRGADVCLVLPARGPRITAEGLRQHYEVKGDFELVLAPAPFAALPTARKWWHALHAIALPQVTGADLVYTRNFPTLFALARGGQAFAYETYRPWPDQFRVLRPAFRAALGSPRCLGAILHSHLTRDCYRALGVAEERLLVAHNGHDPARFLERPAPAALRAELDLPLDRPLVVYTGHINVTKGLDTVLALARRLPHAHFALVGSDGRGVVEALASRHPNVQMVPWQPFGTVTKYLMAADVLLQPPSRVPLGVVGNTVLPMKLFLYLAAGRAILAPDLPDMRELLRNDHNALLVPPGDDAAAAAALGRLLDDRDLRERLGRAALETSAGLTWDARAERVLGFLRERSKDAGKENRQASLA